MNRKVLIVAAHPDNEILGVGGTVLRHVAEGDTVHVMILAEGLTSRDDHRDLAACKDELALLHSATKKAADFMGVQKVLIGDFPDNCMDTVALLEVVKSVEAEINSFVPDLVYTHHAGDVNIDHKITHDAVLTACRPLPGQSVNQILFFETLSSTEWQIMTSDKIFIPNYYVDIESYIEKKLEALHYYETEMRQYPHSRSYEAIKILAQYRGFTIGKLAAEAFEVGRIIVD